MSKTNSDAFRTISEVQEVLGVPSHVLRFWEARFSQVKPVKRAGGRRYYRPTDIQLLSGIKKLLHEEGMTIRGVQELLRTEGITAVMNLASEESHELEALERDIEVEKRKADFLRAKALARDLETESRAVEAELDETNLRRAAVTEFRAIEAELEETKLRRAAAKEIEEPPNEQDALEAESQADEGVPEANPEFWEMADLQALKKDAIEFQEWFDRADEKIKARIQALQEGGA